MFAAQLPIRILWMSSTEGFTVSSHHENSPQERTPNPDEPAVPGIEADQTSAPRPEEEIADLLRAKPDVADHTQHPDPHSPPSTGG